MAIGVIILLPRARYHTFHSSKEKATKVLLERFSPRHHTSAICFDLFDLPLHCQVHCEVMREASLPVSPVRAFP